MALIETNDDENGETGKFDEKDVDRMQCTWGEEATCGLEDDEGEDIEWGLVREYGIRFDTDDTGLELWWDERENYSPFDGRNGELE